MNPVKDIEILGRLGEGAYGCVHKGRLVKTNTIVAVKTIRIGSDDEGVSSTTLREITILQNMDHQNIVKLLDYRIEYDLLDPRVQLIFEFMDEDLSKRLRNMKKLDQSIARNIMKQILEGVQYMHKKKVFHRDLKPQNVLINQIGAVKIADFGLGRIIGHKLSTMSKQIETLWYRAPELLLGTVHYDFSVDIWSVGCIFYEIAQGEVLFQTQSEIGQIFEIMRQCGTPRLNEWQQITKLPNFKATFPKFTKINRKYSSLSPAGIHLLESMIQVNPIKRISIKDALSHPYFSE